MRGTEWIVDGHGCDPSTLRDVTALQALFERVIADLGLTAIGEPRWHAFPEPGGVTGFLVLAESHLACHTFPEFGSICLNVFSCRPREHFDAGAVVTELLAATQVDVRRVERVYGA